MAILSSGPIENNLVAGTRPVQQITVILTNRDAANSATVLIQGYSLLGVRMLYVLEEISLTPDVVITKNYAANTNEYEFVFTTSGPAEGLVEISMWGQDGTGNLVNAQRIVADEKLGN
ncbi:hypothetical protein ACFVQB_25140 [Paenibacillus sp. NPDC057886]|uniref:hypothetical protein n=1 Tax=Paenibacillus sp. NPDC057886 TaxID=3346270 RepID=UPI0036B758B2